MAKFINCIRLAFVEGFYKIIISLTKSNTTKFAKLFTEIVPKIEIRDKENGRNEASPFVIFIERIKYINFSYNFLQFIANLDKNGISKLAQIIYN